MSVSKEEIEGKENVINWIKAVAGGKAPAKHAVKIAGIAWLAYNLYFFLLGTYSFYTLFNSVYVAFYSGLSAGLARIFINRKKYLALLSPAIFIAISTFVSIFKAPNFYQLLKHGGSYVIQEHQITAYGIYYFLVKNLELSLVLIFSYFFLFSKDKISRFVRNKLRSRKE